MKGNSASPGGPMKSKPTWSSTFGCSATSAFFVLGCVRRSPSLRGGSRNGGGHCGADVPARLGVYPGTVGAGMDLRESVTRNGRVAMLVLSRKNQESVVVGGADGFHRLLRVTVLEISRGRVRLGFEVDREVPVHRSEVWERINGRGQAESLTRGPAPPAE